MIKVLPKIMAVFIKRSKNYDDINGTSNNNIFTSFGLDYKYLDDGHDIEN